MHDSLRRMDDWIDLLVVVLVVAAVGVAATVPRLDRDTWEPVATLTAPACGDAAAGCFRATTFDP